MAKNLGICPGEDWSLAGGPIARAGISNPALRLVHQGPLHTVVHAIAHMHKESPLLTEERFVAGVEAATAVGGGGTPGISFGFNHYAPEEAAVLLAFHHATD